MTLTPNHIVWFTELYVRIWSEIPLLHENNASWIFIAVSTTRSGSRKDPLWQASAHRTIFRAAAGG